MRQLEAIGATQLVVADTPALVAEIFDTLVEQRLSRFRKLGRFDLLTQKSAVGQMPMSCLRRWTTRTDRAPADSASRQ